MALAPATRTLRDLGYTDTGRFLDAIETGAHFLVRIKAQHAPKVLRVHEGERVRVRDMRLTNALLQGVRRGVIDVDVQLEKQGRTASALVVAVQQPEGQQRWYLTTVGSDVLTALKAAEAYRPRWREEVFFKAPKSRVGLTALRVTRLGAVSSLVYAKVIDLTLSHLLEFSMQQKAGTQGEQQATGVARAGVGADLRHPSATVGYDYEPGRDAGAIGGSHPAYHRGDRQLTPVAPRTGTARV
ncbi:transposase [Myxococcus sp. AM001]|nr:transposase [Myxococcus sp. AM001]